MKTINIKSISLAIILLVGFSISTSAQNFFFDKKWEDGKMISKVKYEKDYSGLHKATFKYDYSYDLFGELKSEEVFKWDKKKSDWIPYKKIINRYDDLYNITSSELYIWNKKEGRYNEACEKIIYQMDKSKEHFSYLVFEKNGKRVEMVNELYYFASSKDSEK